MSVAKCLGVDDVDGPTMTAAVVAWQRWCHQDPELAVVADLIDLPGWTRRVTTATKDGLLVQLHRLAQDDAEAALVLAWLLLPGATRLANSLRDLSRDIDELTAGELWLRIRSQPAKRCVAATILREVRRSLLGELGHGEFVLGTDRTWARTRVCNNDAVLDSLSSAPEHDATAESELGYLVQEALFAGAISYEDASLLDQLARAADENATPSRRGRGGLTAPKVVESAMRFRTVPTRTVRRRATVALDQLGAFARDEGIVADLRDFIATHDLPPVELEELLEFYFWDHFDEHATEFGYPA